LLFSRAAPAALSFEGVPMHRLPSAARPSVRKRALVVGLVALGAAAGALAAPPISNGGARMWLAFDPEGRTIGPVQFLQKIVTIANTSNAANAFTVFYEPQHLSICA
jgi:hypothetical protein